MRLLDLLRALRDTHGAPVDLLAERLGVDEPVVQRALDGARAHRLAIKTPGEHWRLDRRGRRLLDRVEEHQHDERHEAIAWMVRGNRGLQAAA